MPRVQKTRKRAKRRRPYLIGTLVLIVIVAIGWAVYSSLQSASAVVYAKLDTSHGLIEVELYQSKTPKTVANFVSLARSGFYDNLVWHRIVKADPAVIQTGDPKYKKRWGQVNLGTRRIISNCSS